jgi:hypothetical protein
MAYLIFANEQEADNRSRDAWEQVLDRPKNVEDVTEFLWGPLGQDWTDGWPWRFRQTLHSGASRSRKRP